MNDILNILQDLQKIDAQISVVDEKLTIEVKKGAISDELRLQIKENRDEIINYIKQTRKTIFNSIPKVKEKTSYKLSSSQRRLWVLSHLEDENIAYNVPGIYVFEGNLKNEVLEKAFSTLIERHEILRTVFRENETGEIEQQIHNFADVNFKINYKNLQNEDEKVHEIIKHEVVQPFDLANGPLLRVNLLKTGEETQVLVCVMHHIIVDGWSMGVIIKELMILYNTYSEGQSNPLPPLRIQYKDYAEWQQSELSGTKLIEHKSYWMNVFSGELPILEMPTDRTRPAIKTFNGSRIARVIDKEPTLKLKELCKENGATLYMGLVAVVKTLLYRYTGQEDIIIGSPIAGREHADLEDQIGFYVNTLALRTRFSGNDCYEELLNNIKQVNLSAYEHQIYPFDQLIDDLDLRRDLSRQALFDIMIVLQNAEITGKDSISQEMNGITIKGYPDSEHSISKFDLTFDFREINEDIYMLIEYNTDIYNRENIELMGAHIESILKTVITSSKQKISELNYLTTEETNQLLKEFNNTRTDCLLDKTVIDLFEEQVKKTPAAIGLVYEDVSITYEKLNNQTNQLAKHIQSKTNIKRGMCVGVLIDRSELSAIYMIAIMKLGCVYVPIDKMLPAARIEYIIKESGMALLITDEIIEAENTGINICNAKELLSDLENYNPGNLGLIISGKEPSFIIYTSGSTGTPKGVKQTHLTLYNLILWDINGAKFKKQQKHLQFSSFGFDSSLHDIYYALSTGGEVHIVSDNTRKDLWQLKDYVIERNINVLSMPYSALKVMYSEIPVAEFKGHSIQEIISTGEQLYISGGLREFLVSNPDVKIYNLYGPSETHVVTGVSYDYKAGFLPEKTSIGKPIDNTAIYILDNKLQLVPIGVEGEVFIAGYNLAIGYHERDDLTSERFVKNPFNENELVYKSGDIAKWLPNGEIEYLMRKDNQVKVNGYRLELDEIESVLRSVPSVRETIVIVKEDEEGSKNLVAYVVGELDVASIRSYLKSRLPEYMIPGYFVSLEQLPLTTNGKIDKKALPSPEGLGMSTGVEYKAPANETEEKLVQIWSEVLNVAKEKIGVNDDFFALGGHSLKATRLISKIRKEFKTDINMKNIFLNPTVATLSEKINNDLWFQPSLEEDDSNYDEIKL